MTNEEIVKELRDLLDCNNFKHMRDDIEALITKLQPKHRHISSGNLNYSGTYYTCETCGADIEDEDEELDVSQNKIDDTKGEPEEKYKCKICGGEINKGEFDTFGVCDGCWDKPEEK